MESSKTLASIQSSIPPVQMENQSIVSPVSTIYRSFDDGYTVRSMTPSDAAITQSWSRYSGFAVPRYDIPILLELYPPGSRGLYVGEFEGQVVASVIQVPWGKNIHYVGFFYVDEKFRRRGFGSRILNVVAREHAGNDIVVLDAIEGWVVETYKAWGYKEVFKVERVKGVAQTTYNVDSFEGKILSSKEIAFEEILRYDNKCFVSRDFPTRRDFLRKLIDIPRGATFVAVTGSGSVVGFGCRRPCKQEGQHIVGPVYAEDRTIAENILARLCSEVSGDYINMDICIPNDAAVALVKKFGFEHFVFGHRMHLNGDPQEFKAEVFAMTSSKFCGF